MNIFPFFFGQPFFSSEKGLSSRKFACTTAALESDLLRDVVVDDDVVDLVQQLCQGRDGGGRRGNILHAATPHEAVQLPVRQARAVGRRHQKSVSRRRGMHAQQQTVWGGD